MLCPSRLTTRSARRTGQRRSTTRSGKLSEAIARLSDDFTVKDSGKRHQFNSGMVRDTAEGKTDFLTIRHGPMYKRWAAHLTRAKNEKYPDIAPGIPNWTQANSMDEWLRARESAARHFEQWLNGDDDEDHAAAVYFNINVKEYAEQRM